VSLTLVIAWRSFNLLLATAGLVLLYFDLRGRQTAPLSARFYWQAVALLLFSSGYSSAKNIVLRNSAASAFQITLTTVALAYFVISIAISVRNRRKEKVK
jgi:hypothetical protein